jgi:hypothetical protein
MQVPFDSPAAPTHSGQALRLRFASLRMTDLFLWVELWGTEQKQMQVLRLATELFQHAKSGALVFGCFAQDDRFVFMP